ncbi:MAG TPA: 4-alpha-glucanotransferase [Myxococcales bacterium]|nr:4-alpha-glucanotransferase [Myxococcales bacterium]
MQFKRAAGVILHISSLPGNNGIGDLGEPAHRFVDYLVSAGQAYWQILPVGPNDQGNPYCAQSSWAGSPFLISLDELARLGDLTAAEVEAARAPHRNGVDYGFVLRTRRELLAAAAKRFFESGRERDGFEKFCSAEAAWLEDWALFAAAKVCFGGEPWWKWPKPLALRSDKGLAEYREKLSQESLGQKYIQYRFFQQWDGLRRKAAGAGVKLIGDVPIYTARDSADVWASRELFLLKPDGTPKVVSGVPPDYFAADGQLWGTPIYDWKKHAAGGFAWWLGRLRGVLRLCDVVRIDHFRAFESYWEVPAGATTAREGRWVQGPGDDFFAAVRKSFGEAPFIAEDLGIITKAVRELRDRWELPGMRVLQFAFGEGAASPHLPIRYPRNCVVYSGTHDNDTTVGWYEKASAKEKDLFRRYTATDGNYCHYHMIRMAYSSIADLAIVPMQDVLGLGSWARTNTPGLVEGNWGWKLLPEQLQDQSAHMLRELGELFGRLPWQTEAIEMEGEAEAA